MSEVTKLTETATQLTEKAGAIIDLAAQSANNAKQDADRADQAKNAASADRTATEQARAEAQQAEAGAKTAEQNAVAVVSGGEGSLTPAPGKFIVGDSEGLADLGWMLSVPSRAEFEARQAINRQLYNGSGFANFGRIYSSAKNVNEGMWLPKDGWGWQANNLALGYVHDTGVGTSKTGYPVVNVEGALLRLEATGDDDNGICKFLMPDAPKAVDLLSGATWALDKATYIDGKLTLTSDGSSPRAAGVVPIAVEKGKTYLFEYRSLTPQVASDCRIFIHSSDNPDIGTPDTDILGWSSAPDPDVNRYEYTATVTGTVYLHFANKVAAGVFEFDAISVIDKSEVKRTDLALLEVWHEKISDKDIVYPYGNVQYGASTWDGIALDNTLVAQGYSAFGDWDAATTGYGVRWSTLSAAQKHAFVNRSIIYNDGGELVQVRYRIRVVKGVGDDWLRVEASKAVGSEVLRYNNVLRLEPQGGSSNAKGLTDNLSTWYGTVDHTSAAMADAGEGDYGIWAGGNTGSIAYEGKCFAIPIALVPRLNAGLHCDLNKRGTSMAWRSDGSNNADYHYSTAAKKPQTLAQCFEFGTTNVAGNVAPFTSEAWGSINSAWKARPDERKCDAIYASGVGGVIDLRTNCNPVVDLQRTLEKKVAQAISGQLRVPEALLEAKDVIVGRTLTSVAHSGTNGTYIRCSGDITDVANQHYDYTGVVHNVTTGKTYYVTKSGDYTHGTSDPYFYLSKNKEDARLGNNVDTGNYISEFTVGDELFIFSLASGAAQAEGETTFTAIIGDPANYYRGSFDHKASEGNQTVDTGEVVLVDSLTTGSGTLGHFYERLISSSTFDLQTADYTVSANWKDLGPDRADSWITNGLPGEPLLVHPNTGASLIPDATSMEFKLPRTCKSAKEVLLSNDGGVTWSVDTSAWVGALEGSSNAREMVGGNRIFLITYTADACGWEKANNAEVLARMGEVWANVRGDYLPYGPELITHLIGKVPTGTGQANCTQRKSITSAGLKEDGKFDPGEWAGGAPTHEPLSLYEVDSPAGKALFYLTAENNELYLQALFKEMKFDNGKDLDDLISFAQGTVDTSVAAGQPFTLRDFDADAVTTGPILYKDEAHTLYQAWGVGDFNGYYIVDGVVYNAAGVATYKLWDGDGWGDDGKFEVIDGIGTFTDDNGLTCLQGQKKIPLNRFAGADA